MNTSYFHSNQAVTRRPQNNNIYKRHSIRVSERGGKWAYTVFDGYGRIVCHSPHYSFMGEQQARRSAKESLDEVLSRVSSENNQ